MADSRFAPGEALAGLILEGTQPEIPAADDEGCCAVSAGKRQRRLEGAAQPAEEGASAALGSAAEEGAGPSAGLDGEAAALPNVLPMLFPFMSHGDKSVLRLVSR